MHDGASLLKAKDRHELLKRNINSELSDLKLANLLIHSRKLRDDHMICIFFRDYIFVESITLFAQKFVLKKQHRD